jgi:spore coat protein A
VQPEIFGDFLLVNGKIWPFFEVEPREYRVRLLNGNRSSPFTVRLTDLGFFAGAAQAATIAS